MKRIIWINVVLGLWLVFAPAVLGYGKTSVAASTNDILVGLLVATSALWLTGRWGGAFGIGLFEAVCAFWLLMAPFALGVWRFESVAFNDLLVGMVVLLVGLTMTALSRLPVRP